MLLAITYLLVMLVLIWAATAFAQTCAALLPWLPRWSASVRPVDTVVLIPAHNEQASIDQTIRSIRGHAEPDLRVVVVADNCDDETAPVAAAAGAEVIARDCPQQGGKPAAVAFGFEHLAAAPPGVVVIVDADCVVGGKGVSHLARLAHEMGRPIQALNLIDRHLGRSPDSSVAILGNRFHNLVRPLGNAKLGLPCLLMGTGMAIPWSAWQKVQIDHTSLGEDKQLGIDLALAGSPPTFYPFTKVSSVTPSRREDYVGQRTRWEQGHVAVAAKCIPRLISHGLLSGRWGLLGLAVELFVPPVAILATFWFAATLASIVILFWHQTYAPILLCLASAAMLMTCVAVTWAAFSRRLPLRSLLGAPFHILQKLPVYLRLLTKGPQRAWLRTQRHP